MKLSISAKQKTTLELIFVLAIFLFGIGFTLYQNLNLRYYDHFSLLAESFLQGRTDIQENPEMTLDTVTGVGGKKYFWLEPLPGVLMIPLVLIFGHRAPQGYLDFMVTLVSIFLVNRILLTFEGTKRLIPRIWFILIYFFASATISIIWSPQPWFLAQNIGMMFALWGIYEWRTKKRPFLLFLIFLLLFLSRKTLIFSLGAYILVDSLFEREKVKVKFLRLGACLLGAGLAFLISDFYHGMGMTAEMKRDIYRYSHLESEQRYNIDKYGWWSLANVPTNVANYFLSGPLMVKEREVGGGKLFRYYAHARLEKPYLFPDRDGISFFFLGPAFLALFFLPIVDKRLFLAVLGAALVWAGMYLPNFASGSAQLGSRYSAELVPFLFLWLATSLPKFIDWKAKALVVVSMILNAFMILNLTSFYMNP